MVQDTRIWQVVSFQAGNAATEDNRWGEGGLSQNSFLDHRNNALDSSKRARSEIGTLPKSSAGVWDNLGV